MKNISYKQRVARQPGIVFLRHLQAAPNAGSGRVIAGCRVNLCVLHPSFLCLCLIMLVSSVAQADLRLVPGLTPLQFDTGVLIQTVCPPLGQAGGADLPDPDQRDLFLRCNELIETSNENQGQTGGAIDRSLGLSNEELAAAMQQMAHEETAAPGTMATETIDAQLTNLGARLTALRTGASGLSVSGLHFNLDGHTLQANALGLVPSSNGRGGAAGGDELFGWSRLGIFINGNIGFGDRDATDREDGFDFDSSGITVGMDYRFADNLVLGVAFGYADLEADFDTTATVSGGDVDADGYSISAYGFYSIDDFHIDGILSYGWNDYDLARRILYPDKSGAEEGKGADRTATADTDSGQISFGIGAGYDFSTGPLTYGPYVRVNYLDIDIDGYREQGAQGLNFLVNSQDVESLTSVLGGQASYAISHAFGVLFPQVRAEWHHEFEDDSRGIEARFINELEGPTTVLRAETDSPDRNFFTVGVGVSGVFKRGTQAFVNYETVLGLEDIDNHIFTAGIRLEF